MPRGPLPPAPELLRRPSSLLSCSSSMRSSSSSVRTPGYSTYAEQTSRDSRALHEPLCEVGKRGFRLTTGCGLGLAGCLAGWGILVGAVRAS